MKEINSTKQLFSLVVFLFMALTSISLNAQCGTPMSPTVTTVPPTCSSCCDGTATITVSGGCPPYQYTIQTPSGGGPSIPEMNGLCNGNYTVTVIDNCCPSASYTFQALYIVATSINESTTKTTMLVVQNPCSEFINIKSNDIENNGNYEVTIFDIYGKVVYSDKKYISDSSTLIKHNLNNGIYFIVYNKINSKISLKQRIIIEN